MNPRDASPKGVAINHIPLLALLSLTLAACGQTATPSAQLPGVPDLTLSRTVFPNTQAAYDTLVNADLRTFSAQRLGTVTPVAPAQVYLNVLPIPSSADSVRAYVKSSFAAPVTCSLDFGDGASSAVESPTSTRIQTLDHAYNTFGTYTLTVTCVNGGTVVGTQSVTVQAGKKPSSVIDFNTPAAPSNDFISYTTFQEKGFNFASLDNSSSLATFSPDYQSGSRNAGPSQGLYHYAVNNTNALIMTPVMGGQTFSLTSMETRSFYKYSTNDLLIVGTRADGSTVTHLTHQIANDSAVETFDATWTNLTRVAFNPAIQNGEPTIIDNIHAALIIPN